MMTMTTTMGKKVEMPAVDAKATMEWDMKAV